MNSMNRTRVLLFSPQLRERTYPGRPPIYYLSSVLRRAGFIVQTVDVDIAGDQAFVAALRTFEPHIVAGSSLSVQINDAMRLFRIAKRERPSALTILGGNHATAAGEHLYPVHRDYLDGAIVGEGITAMLAIANLVECGGWSSRRTDVPGLIFCDGKTVVRGNPAVSEPPDVYDPDLPYDPSYDFDIFVRPDGRRRRTFQLMTAFGCQNACFFCFSSTNLRGEAHRVERRMSLSSVERILRRAAGAGYEAVYFDDDTFTRDREHAVEIARICKRLDLVFGCHTRPDCEDDDLIAELVANGCRYMFSGLESAVPEILMGANKTKDPIKYRNAYRSSYHTKNMLGLPVCAFLIHGMARRSASPQAADSRTNSFEWMPDTLEDSVASLEFAIRELDPTYLSMNVLRFIPGVPFSDAPMFEFLRPVSGRLHGGYFDQAWLAANGTNDPRVFHPILRAFEGAGSPIPRHMTPQRCYQILRHAVEIVNAKNQEPGRNQTTIVVDPWFEQRFLAKRWVNGNLSYDLASFEAIDHEREECSFPVNPLSAA
jgi:radical SAM superfamily enzyme YgiQ (UPF0313 family)